ncbi:unnamed protein product, partial [Trichobilharzia regenti]
VYNVCRNVTLIDETSGSLWEYALSWLQSVLIVDMKYKCLQALSFINPNFIDAVRLLGQLRGQARIVADDWLVDARHYLEVKQTARTLLAYAAARDISTFQKRL